MGPPLLEPAPLEAPLLDPPLDDALEPEPPLPPLDDEPDPEPPPPLEDALAPELPPSLGPPLLELPLAAPSPPPSLDPAPWPLLDEPQPTRATRPTATAHLERVEIPLLRIFTEPEGSPSTPPG
jgi:resuscitation-promoting factor RpfA